MMLNSEDWSIETDIKQLKEDLKKINLEIEAVNFCLDKLIQTDMPLPTDRNLLLLVRRYQRYTLEDLIAEKKELKAEKLVKEEAEFKIKIMKHEKTAGTSYEDSPFFRALCVAHLEVTAEGHKFLTIDNEVLYVRPCYERMYGVIMDDIAEGYKKFVVTGTPGIGKSQFKKYFMWRWLNEDGIVYVDVDGEKKSTSGASTTKESRRMKGFVYEIDYNFLECHSALGVLQLSRSQYNKISSGAPYFIDMKSMDVPFMHYGFNPPFSIIFSSPNPLRFKEFLKLCDDERFGGLQLIMPPWSLEEVEVGLSHLSTFQATGRETVIRQFKIYGGVPRILVDKNDAGEAMKTALDKKARSILTSMLTQTRTR